MLNKKHLQILFIKVAGISFLITLLLAAPYISRRAPAILKSLTSENTVSNTVGDRTATQGGDAGSSSLEELMKSRKAAGSQIKPSFDSLPVQFFSSNQAFSLNFHKIPADYLVPQAPEVTRSALVRLKELKLADSQAIAEQQAVANPVTPAATAAEGTQ